MVRGHTLTIAFAIPGDLSLPTGGYAYARRILSEWPGQGVDARVIGLPAGFPHPDNEILDQTARLLNVAEPLLIDGLAYGAFSESLAASVGPRSIVLVHHPLCEEQDLTPEEAERLEQAEKTALTHAAGVVASSPTTARDLISRFGMPEDRLTVAIPGTDPMPQAPLIGDPPRILAVGTVTPRKGYSVLVDALTSLRDMLWHCDIHGAMDRNAEEAQCISQQIAAAGLQDRITLHGATPDEAIAAAYLDADVFVAPSLHEGYGMAVVEAMAHGLPIVTTTAGALRETAPCAVQCPPANAPALASALTPLLASREARIGLGQTCRAFAQTLPSWADTAHRVAQAMERLA